MGGRKRLLVLEVFEEEAELAAGKSLVEKPQA